MKESIIKISHRIEDFDGSGSPEGDSGGIVIPLLLAVIVLVAVGIGIGVLISH